MRRIIRLEPGCVLMVGTDTRIGLRSEMVRPVTLEVDYPPNVYVGTKMEQPRLCLEARIRRRDNHKM